MKPNFRNHRRSALSLHYYNLTDFLYLPVQHPRMETNPGGCFNIYGPVHRMVDYIDRGIQNARDQSYDL
jgi:hypothetical protein